jgi:hypothetical protein
VSRPYRLWFSVPAPRCLLHTSNAPLLICVVLYRLYDKDAIAAAQEKESQQPLTLAELFRQTLCFIDEEVRAEVVWFAVVGMCGVVNWRVVGGWMCSVVCVTVCVECAHVVTQRA